MPVGLGPRRAPAATSLSRCTRHETRHLGRRRSKTLATDWRLRHPVEFEAPTGKQLLGVVKHLPALHQHPVETLVQQTVQKSAQCPAHQVGRKDQTGMGPDEVAKGCHGTEDTLGDQTCGR